MSTPPINFDLVQLGTSDLRVTPVAHVADILRMRSLVESVYLDDKVKEYIIDLVVATRDPQELQNWLPSGTDWPHLLQYITLQPRLF